MPVNQTQATTVTDDDVRLIESTFIQPVQKDFPDRTSNYQEMLKQKEAERIEAARIAEEQRQAQLAAQTPIVAPTPLKTPQIAPGGSGGYVIPGSNCVECVYRMTGRRQNGNAGQWIPSSSNPYVGAIMIFYGGEQGASSLGHVAVVTGINSDGSINVAHCNWQGQTRFRSTGKFW